MAGGFNWLSCCTQPGWSAPGQCAKTDPSAARSASTEALPPWTTKAGAATGRTALSESAPPAPGDCGP